MLAKHVTKTKESRTQRKHCDKVTDGEHKQVPPTKISHMRFLFEQRSQSSGKGLTAYRISGSTKIIIANVCSIVNECYCGVNSIKFSAGVYLGAQTC